MKNLNINLNIIIYSLILFFTLNSCRQENFSTKFESMMIEVINSNDNIYADSNSTAIVKVSFASPLVKDQKITFTTSNGALFKMPYSINDMENDTIILTPFSNEAEALLFANTRTPDDKVFISVSINDFTKDTLISFEPSYPNDMMFEFSSQSINDTEELELIATLYKEKGWSSNNLKFDVRSILEDSDSTQLELITSIPEYVFSKNDEVKIPINIVQYSSGSDLRVFASIETNGILLEKSTLIKFE